MQTALTSWHKRRYLAFASQAVVDDDSNVGLMQCGVEGTFNGHAKVGSMKLTGKMFDGMIANFNARGGEMMVDWNHAALSGNQSVEANEAAGWIRGLEKRVVEGVAQLWALVEWTADAAEKIRSKKYRFCSPSIALDDKGNLTDRLVNVALTNIPFLPGMAPIMLSMEAANMADESVTEEKPTEEVAAAAEPVKMGALQLLADKIGKSPEETDAWLSANIDKVAAMVGEMAEAADASTAQASDLRKTVVMLSGQVSQLALADKKRAHDAIVAEVTGYIKEGRIDLAHKDLAVATFSSDRDLATRTYLSGPKVVPVGESQSGRIADPKTHAASAASLSDAQRVVYTRLTNNGFRTHEQAIEAAKSPRWNS
jgi:phage I-like protein